MAGRWRGMNRAGAWACIIPRLSTGSCVRCEKLPTVCVWRECFQACVDAIQGEMSRADEVWEIGALLTDGNNPRREN